MDAASCFELQSWSTLPDHIVVQILLHLGPTDRYNASLVCHTWQTCFNQPCLWRHFHFRFLSTVNPKKDHMLGYSQFLAKHGHHLRGIRLTLDQSDQENRHYACRVIELLATSAGRQLSAITVTFTGENPLFYAGAEFVAALRALFGPTPPTIRPPLSQILHVDLSGLTAAYDDSVFTILAENHPNLQSLNILNRMLICKVSPSAILYLVQKCRKLTELMAYHCSLSDDILACFAESDRTPVEHLEIVCRREEKYNKTLTSEVWQGLVTAVPNLRVSLGFDHTCPLNRVKDLMQPDIPVRDLRLETFTRIFEEVNLAAAFYSSTLEKLVLQTRNSDELGAALLNLARTCKLLKSIYVYCALKKEVVEGILASSALIKEKKDYILKWTADPEPWVVGVEEGD
ncbi:F-box/LRR-repeat protein 21-like [Mizuhopecten yessoensis]|uniref:F-box/LRR-repeat protein 8 n=1 Tax=Mizuhopecten yessoensis TaxID=6573 RepID=A0A210PZ99_MIZYE|nr:F-box/LRR-repeat protein 21-like [Mizuhopecten yessoensis]OWF41827.1 F-box/LRR-repeat protein 8 [Mizuhopecten yessoensis]